jgi:hypothetical protein
MADTSTVGLGLKPMTKAEKEEMGDVKLPETKEYVLKVGQEHEAFTADGGRNIFRGGEKGNDRVTLTQTQYRVLSDKFDSVEASDARAKAQKDADEATQKLDQLRTELAKKGINIDDVLATKPVPTVEQPLFTGGSAVGEETPAPASSAGASGLPSPETEAAEDYDEGSQKSLSTTTSPKSSTTSTTTTKK